MTLTEFFITRVEHALIFATIDVLQAVVWGAVGVTFLVIGWKTWRLIRS